MKIMTEENKELHFTVPINSKEGNQSGEFQRMEDKYLVPLSLKDLILNEISQNMNPSYLDDETTFTLIESLYFDSPQLDFFQHHFLPIEKRYKIRIRRYAPNGVWSEGPLMIELKRKKLGQSKKTRFMIPASFFENLKNGEKIALSPEIIHLNPKINQEKLIRRINKVNELIEKYTIIPTLNIQYHRLAFEKDGFRVTLDQNLSSKAIDLFQPSQHVLDKIKENLAVWENAQELHNRVQIDQYVILEIKHQGQIPAWIDHLIINFHLQKSSFSKYCWFTIHYLNQLRKKIIH